MVEPVAGWAAARGRVAYAVVRSDSPQVLIAENEEVLGRVVALQVIAATPPERLGGRIDSIRDALLEERWGDAVFEWMEATDVVVDAYPDEVVWRDRDLDAERSALELRMTPIFGGRREDGG